MKRAPTVLKPREYMGVVIFPKTAFSGALRWTARSRAGDPLAADTLEGMKALIRASVTP